MRKQVCILTKSYKHGGYCVAGIDLATKKWIRLVNSEDPTTDEIKKSQMFLGSKSVDCLDVMEYDFVKNVPHACQTENHLLNTNIKPKYLETITVEQLADLIEIERSENFIFNASNVLDEKEIVGVDRSLFAYVVTDLVIEAAQYEYDGEIKLRCKCSFCYNNKNYTNISLTDPKFRDESQDGLKLKNVLIVASLPCVPHTDGLYYKFVAKIIPIDEQQLELFENKNTKTIFNDSKQGVVTSSPFGHVNLVVDTKQTPGIVLFDNYELVKQTIAQGVLFYSNYEYDLDTYSIALEHYNQLKYVKNILEKAKREIVKSYDQPLEVVEKQLEELIDLVKVPFKKVDTFLKQNEKAAKKHEILTFASNLALAIGLQDHTISVLNSPAFFEHRWLNASCSKTAWKGEVSQKLNAALDDIRQILMVKDENTASVLAHYYQTLSMEQVSVFLDSLKAAADIASKSHVVSQPIQPHFVNTTDSAAKAEVEKEKTSSANKQFDGFRCFEIRCELN